jgi:hypothetical protein
VTDKVLNDHLIRHEDDIRNLRLHRIKEKNQFYDNLVKLESKETEARKYSVHNTLQNSRQVELQIIETR